MTPEDLKLVRDFLVDQKIDILNTRAFKRGDTILITVGSITTEGSLQGVQFKGQKFDIL